MARTDVMSISVSKKKAAQHYFVQFRNISMKHGIYKIDIDVKCIDKKNHSNDVIITVDLPYKTVLGR